MQSCLLFGLFVLVVMFLVPQGAKLCRSAAARRRYKLTLLSIYVGGVLWLTLFNRMGMDVSRMRIEPFTVLRLLLKCRFGLTNVSTLVCQHALSNSPHLFDSVHATPVEDLLLNIILFMPLGFLLPYIRPRLCFWQTALAGVLLSACIEITQYLAHWGCCDIDDIFNNTFGACVGYGCWAIYKKLARPEHLQHIS